MTMTLKYNLPPIFSFRVLRDLSNLVASFFQKGPRGRLPYDVLIAVLMIPNDREQGTDMENG